MEFQLGERLFEWDENKNRINIRKHGVNFKTAAKVFDDENRREDYDWEHSIDEDRYRIIGKVKNILVVIYTERGVKTRIISARKAEDWEERLYYGDSDIHSS